MKKSQLILWICIIIIVLFGVQILFSIPAPCKGLEAVWEAGDFIFFVGTISLGLVTVYQTKKANEIIIDLNKNCVVSNKYSLSTSCKQSLIQVNDTVPFLLGMDSIWEKVAEREGQSLLLSLEFKIMNSDGEEYLEQISLNVVNAYYGNILTPVIFNKKVYKSKLITELE